MSKINKILLFCLCFLVLNSKYVYADEVSYFSVVNAKDYEWYAEDGTFSAGSVWHGTKNDINEYTFYVFSKNSLTRKVKTIGIDSNVQIQNIDFAFNSSVLGTLKSEYLWTDSEVSFLSSNFTYRQSNSLREDISGEQQVYTHNEHVFFDYGIDNSGGFARFLNDLKPYFFNDDLWEDGKYKHPESSGDDKWLPLLNFKINQALTMGEGIMGEASVKYTFSWSVAQHELYADNPNKYVVQMLATAKYTQKESSGTTTVVAEDVGYINPECNDYVDKGIPIYKESYSFLERTYREKLCEIAGVDKFASSAPLSYYYLFVRVVEPETGKTSMWKVYKCQGRNITPSGYYYDDEGNKYAGNTDDDEIDNSTKYDPDSSTDDTSSPTSSNYNDGTEMDAQHLLNNLEEIVATLKGIPELFEKVFLWMPDYLIVLIATSIGLILVVGFVKMFLH